MESSRREPYPTTSHKRRRSKVSDVSDNDECGEFFAKLDRLGNELDKELEEGRRRDAALRQLQQHLEDLKTEHKAQHACKAPSESSSSKNKSAQAVRERFVAVKTVSPQTRSSGRKSALPTPAPEASGNQYRLNTIPTLSPVDKEHSPGSPLGEKGRNSFDSASTLAIEPEIQDSDESDGAQRQQLPSQAQSSATLPQESQRRSRSPSSGRGTLRRGRGRPRGRLSRGGFPPASPKVPGPSPRKSPKLEADPSSTRTLRKGKRKNYTIQPVVDDEGLTASQDVHAQAERRRLKKILQEEGNEDEDYSESQTQEASYDIAVEDEEDGSYDGAPRPTKRGPGRPRKIQRTSESVERESRPILEKRPRRSRNRRGSSGDSGTTANTGRGSHPPLTQDPAAFAELKRNFSETPKFGKHQRSLDAWYRSPPLGIPGPSR